MLLILEAAMARYPLNLPTQLKQDAEKWAALQGVSLNQFISWAVSEKVGALNQQLDDLNHPLITYRTGASGAPTPVVRGAGIRVQTVVIAKRDWGLTKKQIANEFDLSDMQVESALSFYRDHQDEIDLSIALEEKTAMAYA